MAGRLAAGLLKNNVLVGQVVPSNLQNALKVQVGMVSIIKLHRYQ